MTMRLSASNGKSISNILVEIWGGGVRGHWLGFLQFQEKLKTEWTDSILGSLWNFLEPIVLALVFYVIKAKTNVNFGEQSMPYVVYVYVGIVSFQLFFRSISIALQLFIENGKLLNQVKIEPESLVWSGIYRCILESLYGYVVLFLVLLATGCFASVGFSLFLFPYFMFTFFAFFLGLLISPFNAVAKDVSKLVLIWTRPLMFISPTFMVFDEGVMLKVNQLNPIGVMMTLERKLLSGLYDQVWIDLSIWGGLTLFLIIGSLVVFRVTLPVVVEKI